MPRSRRTKRRPVKLDDVFHSSLASKFINQLMQRGKKTTAEKVFYSALSHLSEDRSQSFETFKKALENVMPRIEVRSRRIGGATYQVPTQIRKERAEALAIRWLISSASAKKGKPMANKLAEELQDAAAGQGVAIKRKETMHRMAEANRAFAHFRW